MLWFAVGKRRKNCDFSGRERGRILGFFGWGLHKEEEGAFWVHERYLLWCFVLGLVLLVFFRLQVLDAIECQGEVVADARLRQAARAGPAWAEGVQHARTAGLRWVSCRLVKVVVAEKRRKKKKETRGRREKEKKGRKGGWKRSWAWAKEERKEKLRKKKKRKGRR